jgi:hypothetical protein
MVALGMVSAATGPGLPDNRPGVLQKSNLQPLNSMSLMSVELIIESTVVLLAPPLYQLYLWRKGRTTMAQLRKTAMLFAPLYLLVLVVLADLLSR